MTSPRSWLFLGLALFLCRPALAAASDMVVFFEPGFRAADTAAPAREALQALLPGAASATLATSPGESTTNRSTPSRAANRTSSRRFTGLE